MTCKKDPEIPTLLGSLLGGGFQHLHLGGESGSEVRRL